MAIDKAAVAQIARLAHIRLSEDELAPLADELSRILDWVEQLGEVDTTEVPPMSNAAVVVPPMREDVVSDGACRDAILGNAPRAMRGFFTVPKVVE
jgi:aspartyl-tRNA(Asn)/glutamyl-tRNA(Gln) amidotransferase subunit C